MQKLIKLSLSIFGLLGLVKIFSIVPFNKMAGDDYSSAIMGRLGLWKDVVTTYNGFMGRFTAVLIETPFSTTLAFNGKITIYSVITFSLLFLTILILLKRAFKLSVKNIYLYILSAVLFASFYQLTPNKSESWYWLTGSVVYLWPLILFTFAVSYLFIKPQKVTDYIVPVILSFFAASCNEAFGMFEIVLLGISIFVLRKDKERRKLAIIMFMASIASFLIMFLAPGNKIRSQGYGASPMSIPGSVLYALSEGPEVFFLMLINNSYFLIPLMVIFSMLFSNFKTLRIKGHEELGDILFKIFLTILAGIFLSIVFMLPSFVGLGRVQPERSEISLSFVIVAGLVVVSYFLSKVVLLSTKNFQSSIKLIVFIASLFLLYSGTVFTKTLPQDFFIAKNYSEKYDAMISNFKEIAVSDNPMIKTEVSLPDNGLIAELIDPPGVYSYKNLSLSQYYNIGEVISVEYENE